MIRAVYREGAIHALGELPAEWQEGQELVVDALPADESHESFDEWVADIRAASAGISDEDHNRLMATLEVLEAESKALGRREIERAASIFPNERDAGASRAAS